jgi:hypothetical protein
VLAAAMYVLCGFDLSLSTREIPFPQMSYHQSESNLGHPDDFRWINLSLDQPGF